MTPQHVIQGRAELKRQLFAASIRRMVYSLLCEKYGKGGRK
ncbi:hypothetical protein [Deinococcus irradiatisoli]|nr:hypothetical protein [Deinococcus irradiatisoli]